MECFFSTKFESPPIRQRSKIALMFYSLNLAQIILHICCLTAHFNKSDFPILVPALLLTAFPKILNNYKKYAISTKLNFWADSTKIFL